MPHHSAANNETNQATEKILALCDLTIVCSDFLAKLLPIIACQKVRLFERERDKGWIELGRAEQRNELIETFDSEYCAQKPSPYPERLFSMIDQSRETHLHYASFGVTRNYGLLNLQSNVEIRVDAEYFTQTRIKCTYFVPVAHTDETVWLLYLEDNDKTFFKNNREYAEKVFSYALRLQLWRLKERLDARVIEVQDKSTIHTVRNNDQSIQGVMELILGECQRQKELALTNTNKESKVQQEWLDSIDKIAETAKSSFKDLEEDIDQLQDRLGSSKLKTSPDVLRKIPSSSLARKTEFNISEVLTRWIDEMGKASKKNNNKSIEVTISSTLTSYICKGYAAQLKQIVLNLLNNAVEHGAIDDTILVSVNERSPGSEEKLFLEITVINKLPGYILALMSDLPENNPEAALTGTLYLSDNGDYIVRDPNGTVHRDKLDDTLDLTDLAQRLDDLKLKNSILDVTSKREHTQTSTSKARAARPTRSGSGLGTNDIQKNLNLFDQAKLQQEVSRGTYKATVTFQLDVVEPRPPRHHGFFAYKQETAVKKLESGQKRALIVEDGVIPAKILHNQLQGLGCEAEIVLTIKDAEEKLFKSSGSAYSFVFIDGNFKSGGSGFELGKNIREKAIDSVLIWISASALSDAQKKQRIFNHQLLKPFTRSLLEAYVGSVSKNPAPQQNPHEPAALSQ